MEMPGRVPDRVVRFASRDWPGVVAFLILATSVALLPGDPAGDSSNPMSRLGPDRGTSLPDGDLDTDLTDGASATTEPGGSNVDPRGARAAHATIITPALAKAKGLDVDFGPDCDPVLGRIMVPTIHAPPCVPHFSGDNGGATYQGVTEEKITIAVYRPQYSQTQTAVFYGAGGDPEDLDDERWKQAAQEYVDYFESHYETYGREVEVVFVQGSGSNTDNTAAKADAIRVASDIKAFAALGGPGGALAYAKELASRGVVCIRCGEALPKEFYDQYAPYVWGLFPTQTQASVHVAEWIGKRIKDRNAVWAGDPLLRPQKRVFGHVFFDTPDNDYRSAYDFLKRELGRFGVTFKTELSYTADVSRAQDQARTVISKLKDEGVTTVLLNSDPVYPIFFTQEATRQRYYPEWIAGFAAILNFWSRSYDPVQWSNAFGLSSVPARLPRDLDEDVRVYRWHHSKSPPATSYVYQELWPFFTGIHLAGPHLTPETFRDGMFHYAPTGGTSIAGLTTWQVSYGRLPWGYDDYSGIDDYAEMWWDPSARGRDEINKDGAGMWRMVDGGRRHRAGAWPSGDSRMFDPDGAVTSYPEIPKEDRPPSYDHKHHR